MDGQDPPKGDTKGRLRRCRFCGKLLEEGSVRCTECSSDQLRIYSPSWRVVLALASVLVLPLLAVEFQRRQTIAANEERALTVASAELAELSRVAGDLVAATVGLSEPCFLETSKDEQTCSRELLARLVAFDRNIVAFGWRMQGSINRPQTSPHYEKFRAGFWLGEKAWRWRIRYAVFGLNNVGVLGGLLNCVKSQDQTCRDARRAVEVEVEAMINTLKELSCYLLVDAKQSRLYAVAAIAPATIHELYEGLRSSGQFCDKLVSPPQEPVSGRFAPIERWLLGSSSIRKPAATNAGT